MKYQNKYSSINPSMFEKGSREKKAKKILAVLQNFLHFQNQSLTNKICLDIGGSTGFVAKELSNYTRKVMVIDIDKRALDFGKKFNSAKNIQYIIADAMKLPFQDNTLDIVICNQVYEHVPNSQILMREIYRVLKRGGICYFSAGNKYALMEQHYKLLFLSWLPKKIANVYLKVTRKGGRYYENHLSLLGLQRLLRYFDVYDYTIKIIKNPKKFKATDMLTNNSFISKLPVFILNSLEFIIPTYVFVLIKD